jgi:hypothetical protein
MVVPCGIIVPQIERSNGPWMSTGLLTSYRHSLITNCRWNRVRPHLESFDIAFTPVHSFTFWLQSAFVSAVTQGYSDFSGPQYILESDAMIGFIELCLSFVIGTVCYFESDRRLGVKLLRYLNCRKLPLYYPRFSKFCLLMFSRDVSFDLSRNDRFKSKFTILFYSVSM